MRRHEIDRGSDMNYDPQNTFKRHEDERQSNRDPIFIKDGNAEILRLITRGKNDEENIYVNIPPQQPQYIMVENGGKEILMRRFIDEQTNGKHIIREHYQVVPGIQKSAVDDMPAGGQRHVSEIYVNKSQPGSVVYSQMDPNSDIKLVHTNQLHSASQLNVPDANMQHAYSNQSLIQQELENSLKQQNALLRQILLEKEKLEEKYSQQEVALETQSLPPTHMMAMATQTDCEAGTQTEPITTKPKRRRARSENDDSLSEDEYEYIRYSPPNSPEGVYWIKRRKTKRKSRHRSGMKPRRHVVVVEEVKRKIRTPIKEESEDFSTQTPPKARHPDTRSSILRRMKNEQTTHKHASASKTGLKKDVLMEISDSFDEREPRDEVQSDRRRNLQKMHSKHVEYYERSDDDDDDNSDDDIVIRRNHYSADSLEGYSDDEQGMLEERRRRNHRNIIFSRQGSSTEAREALDYPVYEERRRYTEHVTTTPIMRRLSRRDTNGSNNGKHRRQTTSEPPHRATKGPAPKPTPTSETKKKNPARSEADLMHRLRDDGFDIAKHVPAPRYMEWYYNKSKDSDLEKKRLDEYRSEKEKSKVSNKKLVNGGEKRAKPKAFVRVDEPTTKYKPEPMPRTTPPPPKGARMLREDVQMNKTLAPKIETDSNHPLLQYSEHRYEHEYNPAPDIPVPPTRLPHYMYPETPPLASMDSSRAKSKNQKSKPKPSPIHEGEVKDATKRYSMQSDTSTNQSKQLNASTLEDDHDSGIAMNSLLHSLGKRNPIADKKSVFTIAYDEAKIKKIQSESDSPQLS